jgi:effector-binding domain-containing protein
VIMKYQVVSRTVQPQLLAVARGTAAEGQIGHVVMTLMGTAWNFIRKEGIKGGHNVAVYRGDPKKVPIEAGVEVSERFDGDKTVSCSATPRGRVVMTTHMGSYHLLSNAHDAIVKHCQASGHRLTGVNWEVYGHWNEDESRLRTDVYYLLA